MVWVYEWNSRGRRLLAREGIKHSAVSVHTYDHEFFSA